eukprot:scaffold2871_cov106-Isochrysis_galbana.AAC.7
MGSSESDVGREGEGRASRRQACRSRVNSTFSSRILNTRPPRALRRRQSFCWGALTVQLLPHPTLAGWLGLSPPASATARQTRLDSSGTASLASRRRCANGTRPQAPGPQHAFPAARAGARRPPSPPWKRSRCTRRRAPPACT